MSIRNLEYLFAPRSVAMIGASRKEQSVGQVLTRNLFNAGFAGAIMPVNPKGESVQSSITYRDVADLPVTPDLAVIATPPETVPGVIDALGKRGTKAAVVITAGFAEMGPEGRMLQQRMLEAAKPHLLRIIGPNCLGILAPPKGLNASFAHLNPAPGRIALLAQSGAVVTSVIDWAAPRGIGFSLLASLGGMADVDFGDMLDYLAHDAETDAVLLYIESITHARKFMSAARAVSRVKPVVVVKAGRHAEAAKAAASHTGALAGSDDVYRAAFQRAGIIRVLTLEELFDAAETLARLPRIAGDRIAIITNGGGIGVLATDRLLDARARLAPLAPETIADLSRVLPATWSHANPVDIIGDATGERYEKAIAAVLTDKNVDCLLVLNCPVAVADSLEAARAVTVAAKTTHTPILTSWLGEATARRAREHFSAEGVATYETPGGAIEAIMHLVRHKRNQDLLLEVPEEMPSVSETARKSARAVLAAARQERRLLLTEPEAKAVLKAYGIPVVETVVAEDPAAARGAASEMSGPFALKILSPDITHKTDVGGVMLGLADPSAVEAAAGEMLARVRKAAPDARLTGFTVQPMAHRPGAHELIVGLASDAIFGPVVLFGHGGTAVEVLRDRVVGLPPLNEALARDMILRTRIAKLLAGYRDRPPADTDAIVCVLLKLAEMAADLPDIAELDINPLWADARGVLALDARIALSEASADGTERFAIKPYPRALESEVQDRQGKAYRLRPIRPADGPLLEAMVEACDPEDVRLRFFSALKKLPKSLCARLTQIDYAREMAFVALDAQGAMAGVVHLIEDPDGEKGEYAVIVRSDLKGTGLGRALMTAMLAHARARGLGQVFGQVLADNQRMLGLDAELGFVLAPVDGDPGVVEACLAL